MNNITKKLKIFFGFHDHYQDQDETRQLPAKKATERQPVIKNFKGTLVSGKSRSAMPNEIQVEEPKIYEDSLTIATYLRKNKPVIVKINNLDPDTGKRLIDFVCGTAYAINGHMVKLGENIFLFTPENILIVDSEEKSTFEQGIQQEESKLFLRNVATS